MMKTKNLKQLTLNAVICMLILMGSLQVTNAQAPNAIPYQGVARDATGAILPSQLIGLRYTIRDLTAGGAIVYRETFTTTTTSLGLFNVNIGTGTPVTGTLAAVNWGGGAKFVQVELDPAGGTTYINMGTTQLMSVPYALYSAAAGTLPNGTAVGNTLRWNGTNWVADNALFNNGLQVGIGTAAPSAQPKLHVDGSGSAGTPFGILATSRTGTSSFNTHGVWADGSWRGVYGTNLSDVARFRSIGVQGVGGGTNYSVEAIGVYAEANGTGTAGVNNYGLYAKASGASGLNFAAWMDGTVRISDGTQGVGRIFADDGAGNGVGQWRTAAAAGLVSGSGTTNFVPRWTPDGTTLGNSNMQDNGTKMNIGSIFGGMDNALTVANTPISTNAALGLVAPGGGAGIYTEDATGDMHITLNNNDVANGTKVMSFNDNTLNVGVGTAAPVAKFDVDNSATGKGGLRVNQDNETGIPAAKALSEGVIADISAISVNAGNTSVFAQRENFSAGSISYFSADKAIFGAGMNGNIGVQGASQSGMGVAGVSFTGTALRGHIDGGGPGLALQTSGGGVQLANIGEGAGYVLTSDATGNATWQGPASISVKTLSVPLVVPPATDVVITTWNLVENEDGGANYNAGTGEYTIPVSGYYVVDASVVWNSYSSTTARARLNIYVNGTFGTQAISVPSPVYGTQTTNLSRRFNAGDKISISVNHTSGVSETIQNTFYANNFSVKLIHR